MHKRLSRKKRVIEPNPYISFGKFFKGIQILATGLISLTILAYFIGWFSLSSYYSEMNASWILNYVTPLGLIPHSIPTLLILFVFFYLGLYSIAHKKDFDLSYSYKGLRIGFFVMLLIIIGGQFLNSVTNYDLRISLLLTSLIFIGLYTSYAFDALIIILTRKDFSWNTFNASLIYVMAFYGLYLLPTFEGKYSATLDKRPNHSPMYNVVLMNDTKNYHLLHTMEDKYFIQFYDSTYKKLRVKVVSYDEIMYIEK